MLKRGYKLIICVVLVAALFIGFGSAFASAASPVWLLRAKAGIAAAMMAANLVFEPISAAQNQSLANVIDPLNVVQTVRDTAWTDYIDQSVIVVRPDKVTIDGQEYSEIWLGSNAANALRASGFDFKTAYNILANQSDAVSYAHGVGYLGDTPIYSVGGLTRSQSASSMESYEMGGVVFSVVPQDSTHSYNRADSSDGLYHYMNNRYLNTSFPVSQFISISGDSFRINYKTSDSTRWYNTAYFPLNQIDSFVSSPFDFAYTSGEIDPDPISSENGLLLRVPSSYNDGDPTSVYNYDIHDLVNIYPQVDDTSGHELVFDPSLNPDFDVDLDMGNALGDLITAIILAKLADLLGDNSDVIYAPMPEKDEPVEPGVIDPLPDPDPAPDDPVPGTTIANTDWTKLDKILRWIQSTIDSIRHITESLQTMLDSLFDQLQHIIESLESLPEQLLEDIETGPSKVFRKALDILKSLFLPLLLPIKVMMGLWHYVVEWIASVNTPFVWIFGLMSGASGNMVLPIYAVLAGSICIAIYKCLGR